MTAWITKIIDFFTNVAKRKPKMKARPNTTKHAAGKTEDRAYNKRKNDHQVEIDKVLEKIKQSGYNSLSKSEKEALFKASK